MPDTLKNLIIIALTLTAIIPEPTIKKPLSLEDSLQFFLWKNDIKGANIIFINHNNNKKIISIGIDPITQEKLSLDRIFSIASLSKPITAAAITQLSDKGIFSLNDNLESIFQKPFFNDIEEYKKIKIIHLLQHTAGFDREISGDPLFSKNGEIIGCKAALANRSNIKVDHPPGTTTAYSNFGYCLLGKIIEEKTGTSYEQAVPLILGIDRNTLFMNSSNPLYENYYKFGAAGGWFLNIKNIANILKKDISKRPIDYPAPKIKNTQSHYGLGWRVWEDKPNIFTHFGSLPNTYTVAVAKPNKGIFVAFFTSPPIDLEGSSNDLTLIFSNNIDQEIIH